MKLKKHSRTYVLAALSLFAGTASAHTGDHAAGFALFHGYAHGLEMPLAASPMLYGLGFVLTTVCLHGLGIAGSLIGRHAVQIAGAGIAATGLVLIFAM